MHQSDESGVGTFAFAEGSQSWVLDPDALEVLGLDPTDLATSTTTLLSCLHGEDRQIFVDAVTRVRTGSGAFTVRYRVERAGRVHELLLIGEPAQVDGVRTGARGYVVDLTTTLQEDSRAAVEANNVSRSAIDQVKGALMLTYKLDEAAAFALLVSLSQTTNLKLRDVCAHVARAMADPETKSTAGPDLLLSILTTVRETPGVVGG